ncbi:MAG TPA: hypothetical protein DIU15_04190 [Deltaproteobacteria bacterium]|nr:hypothetical protein [Deltaproteobacteria bacterium]HCP45214.1 hypothetical protein [Deltaproteobacteria bacterium]
MLSRPAPLIILAVALNLVACGGSFAPPSGEACAELADQHYLEIGTGANEFVPLAPGDEVRQSWSDEGGDHVWASLRVGGIYSGGLGSVGKDCQGEQECVEAIPEDAPRLTVALWRDDVLVASYGMESEGGVPFHIEDGEAVGITAVLEQDYSSYTYLGVDHASIDQDIIDAARAVEESRLRFVAVVEDACGVSLIAEEEVSMTVLWLHGTGRG